MTMLLSRTPGLVRDVSMVGRAAQVGRRATPAVYGPHPRVFDECVAWWDAGDGSTSGQSLTNRGWGGSALDLTLGSTTSADTNDPLWLPGAGDGYAYLPGIAGNYLSVPDEAALDITGDTTLVFWIGPADWTPASAQTVFAKWASTGSQRSWRVDLDTAARLVWYVSPDGTTNAARTSTVAVPSVVDGVGTWCAITFDSDNGAVGNTTRFWYAAGARSTVPSSWSQVGADVVVAGVQTIYAGTAGVEVGALNAGTVQPFAGSVGRLTIASGIGAAGVPGGSTVLDINMATDCTSAAATSFTATTGQTVTVKRSTSGRKTVISPSGSRPRYLFGTDDYMECADNDLIDFGATDSFTAWVIVRTWNTLGTGQPWMNKRDTSGWQVRAGGGGFNCESVIDDGPTIALTYTPSWSAGSLSMIANVTNRSTQLVTSALNGTFGSGVSCASVGSVANSVNLRIGAVLPPSVYYADFEFLAAGICRRALTADELYAIAQYYGATA